MALFSEFESSSKILVDKEDISLISDSFECKDKFRMSGAPWYIKLLYFIATITRQTLWCPSSCDKQYKLNALKWVRTYLTHCLRLVQQIANLRHARTDFQRIKSDMLQDRSNLKTDIESTKVQLYEIYEEFKKLKPNYNPTSTISSDVSLLLGDLKRQQELYLLYNDILSLINKTLADTNRIEKLAFLCGTVRKSDIFISEAYTNFESTLYKLLGQVAECDRTKEYINSQLSIAKNSNLDVALSVGDEISKDQSHQVAKNFLSSGIICLNPEELPHSNKEAVLQKNNALCEVAV